MTLQNLLDCLSKIEDKDLIVYVRDVSSSYPDLDTVNTIIMEHDLKDKIVRLILTI